MGHTSARDWSSAKDVTRAVSTIQSISTTDPSSWNGHLFMTFDVDWAHDEILADTMQLVAGAGAAATWFITHDTQLLRDMRSQPAWELGIHPNFNTLLQGSASSGATADKILEDLMRLILEAVSVRSHSMTQSSPLLDAFARAGLTHDVNHFVPSGSRIQVKPWLLWNGMVRVPYIWEDDVHCAYQTSQQPELEPSAIAADSSSGLKVFDFHPIHVFLNTESLDRYERTRPIHRDPSELIKHRFDGYGTRSRLIDLLTLASQP